MLTSAKGHLLVVSSRKISTTTYSAKHPQLNQVRWRILCETSLVFLVAGGVRFEIVSQVPDIHSESDWWRQVDTSREDENNAASKESFLESYTQAVTSIENILSSEKQKQQEYLELLLAASKEPLLRSSSLMQKSLSVMNIRDHYHQSGHLGAHSSRFGSYRSLTTSQLSLDQTTRGSTIAAESRRHRETKRRSLPARQTLRTVSKVSNNDFIAEEE